MRCYPVSAPIRPMIQCFATIRKKTNDKATQVSFNSERQKYCCSKRERCLGEFTPIFKNKSAKRLLKVSFNKNNEAFSPLNTTIKQQHNLFNLIRKVQKQLYKSTQENIISNNAILCKGMKFNNIQVKSFGKTQLKDRVTSMRNETGIYKTISFNEGNTERTVGFSRFIL